MKTREKVKRGELTIAEALNVVPEGAKTYGWLLRRSHRTRAERKAEKEAAK